jgi:ankyrin repeat protein
MSDTDIKDSLQGYFKQFGQHNVCGFTLDTASDGVIKSQDQWLKCSLTLREKMDRLKPLFTVDNVLLVRITEGKMEEVTMLLEMGHDPSWKDKDGKNALAWAMDKQNVPLCRRLMSEKGNFDGQEKILQTDKMTPEMAGFVKKMFDTGLFTFKLPQERTTFMPYLQRKAEEKPLPTLPSTIKAFYTEFAKENPLFAKVITGFKLSCRHMDTFLQTQKDWEVFVNDSVSVKQIVPVTAALSINESSLLSFINESRWTYVETLLLMGFDPEVVYEAEGTNALHWAIYKHNLPLIKKLVTEYKMDLTKKDNKGHPSFFYTIGAAYDDELFQWISERENVNEILTSNTGTQFYDRFQEWKKKEAQEKPFDKLRKSIQCAISFGGGPTPWFQYLLSILDSETDNETKKVQLKASIKTFLSAGSFGFVSPVSNWLKENQI